MRTTPNRPLVLVTCGAAKQPTAHPAGQMYLGSYHRLALRAAHALTDPAAIRVLSASHGLLELETIIEPYDTRITDPDAITAPELLAQAHAQGIANAQHVVILAAAAYSRLSLSVWPHAHVVFAGTRGIGEQRQRLSRLISTGQAVSA